MSFLWPAMLVFLAVIPLLAALYLRLQQRRQAISARYGSFGIASGAAGVSPGLRRHAPPALFLAGLTILVVAMARPQATVSLPRMEGTVILAFDVSGSMAADDLQPTRIDAAKAAALVFVERMPSSVDIGVVAFSDSGFSVLTPTNNPDAILATIQRLSPERGTSLAQGILASLNTITGGHSQTAQDELPLTGDEAAPAPLAQHETYDSAVIVLLSDGENNMNPDPFAAAELAADYRVRIYTVGVGSAAGSTVEIDGFQIHTQLDEATLWEIADITGGAYFNATDETELNEIYEKLVPQLVIKPEKIEITSLLAGASIFILLAGAALSLVYFNRLP